MVGSGRAPSRQRVLQSAPDLLQLHEHAPQRYPFLLQSVAQGTAQSRFDLLLAFPQDHLELSTNGALSGSFARLGQSFLGSLDAWWQELARPSDPSDNLPFLGGWFLYLGYELAAEIEPILRLPETGSRMPTAMAVRCPAAVIRDHARRRTLLVAEAAQEECLEIMEQDVNGLLNGEAHTADRDREISELTEEPDERFLDGVKSIRRYIREGDVFQVNLSRAWQATVPPEFSDARCYQRLCRENPGPFAGLALVGNGAIISSSPERLVSVRNGRVETRPIAGTFPRGSDLKADKNLSDRLLRDPKERAEHIMLIDLERNDLGRVCENGSVTVDELLSLESYSHVHHIVSNVSGQLRKETTPGRVIGACFPGGTITGCPKVRCMQIIAELEGEGRGPYTGAMGYLNRDGSMDLNILIRTLVRDGNRVALRAGAGIVADSNPLRELEETRHKARGPLAALTGTANDPG